MTMRMTCAGLCMLPLLAACGVENANGEGAGSGASASSGSSVSVVRYCEKFAEAYSESNAVEPGGLPVRTERKPGIMMWLSNAFSPPDSRFTAGYDCHFSTRNGDGRIEAVSVGIFLTGTLDFAHYTKWKNLQIIPVEHVADETRGRAGYGVFKYLKER